MPKVHGSRFTVHSFGEKRRRRFFLKRELVSSKPKRGFSLIELLIVISLFGFAATLITVGYSGFSRRQLLTNGVNGLKSNLRFAQSQSASGVKDNNACSPISTGGPTTTYPSILKGWYIEVNLVPNTNSSPKNNSYNIKSLCVYTNSVGYANTPCSPPGGWSVGTYECGALYRTVNLPDNVEFSAGATAKNYYILFEPLKSEPTFFVTSSPITQFFDAASLASDPRNATFNSTICCSSTLNPSGITFGMFETSSPATVSNVVVSASGGVQ